MENQNQDYLIDEIIRHLDSEIGLGAARMSVGMDETQEEHSKTDRKCCHMYGRPANEVVGLLDMYSDTGIEVLREP
ncbi:MAG: hypothetical protein NC517_07075 [Firmicutes bacterium]|nr:hypothetical protein [Bacillota bacterium]